MKQISKIAVAVALTGAFAVAAATPSYARDGRIAAGVAAGVVGGAIIGAAAANANNGYYYGPGYAYDPAPTYYSGYDDSYAYEPAPAYQYGYGNSYRSNNYGNPYGKDQGISSQN